MISILFDGHKRIDHHRFGLSERDTVLPLVDEILDRIPVDVWPFEPR